jgi:hypothetical protein
VKKKKNEHCSCVDQEMGGRKTNIIGREREDFLL